MRIKIKRYFLDFGDAISLKFVDGDGEPLIVINNEIIFYESVSLLTASQSNRKTGRHKYQLKHLDKYDTPYARKGYDRLFTYSNSEGVEQRVLVKLNWIQKIRLWWFHFGSIEHFYKALSAIGVVSAIAFSFLNYQKDQKIDALETQKKEYLDSIQALNRRGNATTPVKREPIKIQMSGKPLQNDSLVRKH